MTGSFDRTLARTAAAFAVAAFAAILIVSCSGRPRSASEAVRRMVQAHGGPRKIERLQTFTGRGFIRDLSDTVVAKSVPFDLYRRGPMYKHKVMRAQEGKLKDVIILAHDGRESFEWRNRSGLEKAPMMELGMLPYRFPAVLTWVQEKGRSPRMLPAGAKEREIRLRYTEDDVILTVSIDRSSRLLGGIEVRSVADTSFVYSERYGTYMEVEGIPFPARFTAAYRGLPLYEYLISAVELGGDLPDSLFSITRADTAVFAR